MADTNVRIKLTADGSQVQNTLKLIDEEAKRIGKNVGSAAGSNQRSELGDDTKVTESGTRDAVSDRREKILRNLYNELKLLRKEMQKGNQGIGSAGMGSFGGESGGGIPLGGSSGGSSSGSGGAKGVGNVLGKIASVVAVGNALNGAKNYVMSGAQASATGESLAYQTYGSTLAYQDYYQAKKSSYDIGKQYGYDYTAVMQSGTANMESGAGWTTRENYANDMDAILKTSKAWGLDSSALASTSGKAAAMGITESGNQSAFTKIIANAIVDSGMIGREDELLTAVGGLQENIGSKATTVSEEALKGSLGMYNTLVNQNENLKGERGASLIQSMQDMASSDDTSLQILAGFRGGLNDKQEFRKLGEENPAEMWQRIAQGAQQMGMTTPQLREFFYRKLGSQSKADELVEMLPQIADGSYKFSTDNGERETNARIENRRESKVSSQELYDIQKQDAKETAGNALNEATRGAKDFYNDQSDWGRVGFSALGGIANMGIAMLGGKLLGKGAGKLLENTKIGELFGKGGTAAAAGETAVGAEAAAGAAGGATRAASAEAGGIGKILGGVGKGAGKAVLKKLPIVGTIATLGLTAAEVSNAASQGNEKEAAQAAGSGIGGLAGAAGGAAAGAAIGSLFGGVGAIPGTLIGGIIGGLGLGIAGDAAGGAIGGAIYDAANAEENVKTEDDNTKATEELTESLDSLNDTMSGVNGSGFINQSVPLTPSQSSLAAAQADSTTSSSGGIFDSIGGFFGGIGSAIGNLFTGHAVGNDYVPRDNYLASLHKGEMVLNKLDADDYRQGKVGAQRGGSTSDLNLNISLSGGISGMTSENQNQIVQAVVQQIKGGGLQSMLSNGFSRVPNY